MRHRAPVLPGSCTTVESTRRDIGWPDAALWKPRSAKRPQQSWYNQSLLLRNRLSKATSERSANWPLSPGPRFLASNSHSPNARATPSKDFPPTYLDAIPSKPCSGELASSNPMEKTITVDPSPRRLHCFQACTVFIENLC